jgi:hypothetical protein
VVFPIQIQQVYSAKEITEMENICAKLLNWLSIASFQQLYSSSSSVRQSFDAKSIQNDNASINSTMFQDPSLSFILNASVVPLQPTASSNEQQQQMTQWNQIMIQKVNRLLSLPPVSLLSSFSFFQFHSLFFFLVDKGIKRLLFSSNCVT